MRYVFFGTPRFAEIILQKLLMAGMPPCGLVCNPDRPLGRKKIITPPPTKVAAMEYAGTDTKDEAQIKIFQPEKLDGAFIEQLRALSPDFFVVAAYAKIIPQTVLSIPRLGTLGVHPSLLPKYRGASPIQSVILNGERETGVAIYAMDEKMDHGPVFAEEKIPMDSLTTDYPGLESMLAELGATLLIKTIPAFFAGGITPKPQDESQATFTKKFITEEGFIKADVLDAAMRGDGDQARTILRKINAFTPEPGAWTIADGKRVKLLKAATEGSALRLITIQKDGERPTAFRSF